MDLTLPPLVAWLTHHLKLQQPHQHHPQQQLTLQQQLQEQELQQHRWQQQQQQPPHQPHQQQQPPLQKQLQEQELQQRRWQQQQQQQTPQQAKQLWQRQQGQQRLGNSDDTDGRPGKVQQPGFGRSSVFPVSAEEHHRRSLAYWQQARQALVGSDGVGPQDIRLQDGGVAGSGPFWDWVRQQQQRGEIEFDVK